MKDPLSAVTAGLEESSGEKTLYCSFCGKSQQEVRKLVQGPVALICDECVDLCHDIVLETVGTSETRSLHGLLRLAMDRTAFDSADLPRIQKAVEDQDVPFVLDLYRGKLEALVSGIAGCLTEEEASVRRERAVSTLTALLISALQCVGLLGVRAEEISTEVTRWFRDRPQPEA